MYTTTDLINAKLGSFASLITTGMETTDIEGFIVEADDMIDGYLAALAVLPFSVVPKLISSISLSISVRNLWAQKQAKSLPEHVIKDYDNALKLLELIAKGTLKLSAQDADSESFNDLKFSAAARSFGTAL